MAKHTEKKSKINQEIKDRKIKSKEKNEKEKQKIIKEVTKITKKEKFIESLNSVLVNFLSVSSTCFILSAMALGLWKVKQGDFESVLAGLICCVFIVVGTWFNEKIIH